MARQAKANQQLTDDLAQLASPDYVPTTTREIDAPANLRRLEFDKLKFDYDLITNQETRAQVQDAAVEINMKRKRAAEDIFMIGAHLLKVEALLADSFDEWIKTEFDYSTSTANEFMHVARRFQEDPTKIVGLPVTAVRLLGAPTLPQEGVESILQLAEQREAEGNPLKVYEVRELVDQIRPEEDKKPYRRERIARTISANYSVAKTDDPLVKTLLEAPHDKELAAATQNASKAQLGEALRLLAPDDKARRSVLQYAIDHYERHHPDAAPSETAPITAPAISTRRKDGVFVEMPRSLWGKLVEALRAFDLNPNLSDKEALKIVKLIENSLETQ